MTPAEKLMSRISYDMDRGNADRAAYLSSVELNHDGVGSPVLYVETADHELFTLSIAAGTPE